MLILTTLQAGKSFAVDDMAKIFSTSRRTIFRDLKELQAIGVPYNYNAKTRGYTMDPDFFLPPVDLNLREALALLLLVHTATNQLQLPFQNSALLAALKIENNLPLAIRKYCNTAIRNISTRPAAQATMTTLDNTFARLQKAITKKRRVCITYDSFFERKVINLDLCPYHILYNRRAWYVLGYSGMHKTVRTFKLNRIKQLEMLDKCFITDQDFDLAEYLGKAWAMIPQGRIYHVKLRFSPMVARNVAEVHWHRTQKIIYNSNGSITAEFLIDGLGEITWWILGYGDQVRVLEPGILRRKIRQIAQNMTRLNAE